jgi:hypothetical protein
VTVQRNHPNEINQTNKEKRKKKNIVRANAWGKGPILRGISKIYYTNAPIG